jgi:hypothetical protein
MIGFLNFTGNPLKSPESDEGIQGNPRKSKTIPRGFQGDSKEKQDNPKLLN